MLVWLLFAVFTIVPGDTIKRPGSSFSCPDTATCCELIDKSYGCCPLENAVCCDDHIHCCPVNSKCDAGICIQLHARNKTAKRLSIHDKDIKCFGSEYVCPDNTTCCKGQAPGTYGCCPMDHAVCCSDNYHCCPEGTICDLKAEKCVGKDYVSEMYDSQKNTIQAQGFQKYSYLTKPINITSVFCPDSSFQCPNGYTCCKLPTGNWGCCPFVKATCCLDHLHCCPQNMQCDSTSQACTQGKISIPALLKELSVPINVGITCPDNSTCAESMTCCALDNKQYGCCPYIDAVCCKDHSHCCPYNYTCDVAEKRCVQRAS